jgi:hypothetical protein
VKNVDPSPATITEGLVVDVRLADEEVFFKTRHIASSKSHYRSHRRQSCKTDPPDVVKKHRALHGEGY